MTTADTGQMTRFGPWHTEWTADADVIPLAARALQEPHRMTASDLHAMHRDIAVRRPLGADYCPLRSRPSDEQRALHDQRVAVLDAVERILDGRFWKSMEHAPAD